MTLHPRRKRRSKKQVVVKRSQIKKVIQSMAELKFFDTVPDASVTTTEQAYCFSAVPAGTSDTTRIGDSLYIKNIQAQFELLAADATQIIRYIVFQFHDQSNFTVDTPTLSDILQDASAVDNLHSFYHGDRRAAYTILRDRRISMTLGQGNGQKMISFNIRSGFRKKVQYQGASTNNASDHIYMIIVSDSGAAAHPTIRGFLRLQYYDM